MDRGLPCRLLVMEAVASTRSRATTWQDAPSVAVPWARAKIAALAIAALLALGFRISALSTYGFSEDELNKIHAIDQYRAGHFIANAEHPMLMKLAMWGSVDAAEAWNRLGPPHPAVSPATALPLPHAVARAAATPGPS